MSELVWTTPSRPRPRARGSAFRRTTPPKAASAPAGPVSTARRSPRTPSIGRSGHGQARRVRAAPPRHAPGSRQNAGTRSSFRRLSAAVGWCVRLGEDRHVPGIGGCRAVRSGAAGSLASRITRSGRARSSIGGPGPPPVLVNSTMPIRPSGLRALAAFGASAPALHLVIASDNQDCIERPDRQAGSRRSESNDDIVIRILERQPPLRYLDHLRLDVLRVDPAVGPTRRGQPDGEPTAGGAEIGHDAAFGDVERVHDLLGALPDVAIGTLELTEVFGREQFPPCCCRCWPATVARRASDRSAAFEECGSPSASSFLVTCLPSDSSGGAVCYVFARRDGRRCSCFRRRRSHRAPGREDRRSRTRYSRGHGPAVFDRQQLGDTPRSRRSRCAG